MTIELTTTNIPASTTKAGSESYNLSAGKTIKIETSPKGDTYLDAEVPEGKAWVVKIQVRIIETDV